ncbi:MAG: chitobiase/beta-hexosaminidase C-terminal domain-containing protein [Spirochaetales bacterium]|nr:chitobiase/beta-hexosaminidase C-terminal domain-containing protein [Spirochaetales bacterium]
MKHVRMILGILLFCAGWSWADSETSGVIQFLQPPPGKYAENQRVTFEGEEAPLYRFLESSDKTFCRYTLPLQLTALPEEERVYTLEIQWGDRLERVLYSIDRKAPEPPVPDLPEGVYQESISLSLSVPEDSVLYASADSLPGVPFSQESLRLEQDRLEDKTYTVYAYSVDAAGNASAVQDFTYTLRKSTSRTTELPIYSPVEGEFRNKQIFACDPREYTWVRYSLDGRDPESFGLSYHQPVLLDKTGSIKLRIAALPIEGKDVITREISYSVFENQGFEKFPPQGMHAGSIILPVPEGAYLFTFDDSSDAAYRTLYRDSFSLLPIPGGMKVYTLRFKDSSETRQSGVFRLVYVLDSRIPEPPVIRSENSGSPVSSDTRVFMESAPGTRMYYSLDGRTPDNRSTEYNGPITLTLPEKISFGSIIIKARAYGINGKVSQEASYLLTFDKEPPKTPEVRMLGPRDDGSYTFSASTDYGSSLVYELSNDGTYPKELSEASLAWENSYSLQVPFGMDANFLIHFAALDEAGNLSPATKVFSVPLDRLPPPEPEIQFQDTYLRISGEGEISYRTFLWTKDGETSGDYQSFTDPVPLDLPVDLPYRLKIEAYAVDAPGNRSAVVSKTLVKKQEFLAAPTIYLPGGKDLVNSPTAELRALGASPLHDIRYTLTTDGSEPEDPTVESAKLSGFLMLQGVPDTETTFRVKARSFSPDTPTVFSDPVEARCIIDLLRPNEPILYGFSSGGVYKEEITLSLEIPGSHRAFISYSLDESTPPDPFGPEGIPISGTYTLDTDPGTERNYYLRAGLLDAAGNRSVTDRVYHVTLDRKPPEIPEPLDLPSGGISSGSLKIHFAPFEGRILYNLSRNGLVPTEPDEDSTIYKDPIILQGIPEEEILYVLKVSCVDKAGNQSLGSKTYSFTLDQKSPEIPSTPKIILSRNRDAVFISWEDEPLEEVVYRIAEIRDTWYSYNGPQAFQLPETRNKITLEYYAKDIVGNRSPLGSVALQLPFSLASPLFKGAENGALYNQDVRIYKTAGPSVCRYEIGVNREAPPQVTEFSPVLPEVLDFKALEGETVQYTLAVKMFPTGESRSIAREQRVHFYIDRDKPFPPSIDGIRDGVHYQDDRTISFYSDEGKIFYTVQKDKALTVPAEEFAPYNRPLALVAEEGTLTSFAISAFVIDEAGNRSDLQNWSISVDKEIIYLSDEGNDGYDGTRTHPFRSLQKALEHARETGRKTLWITGGYYPIDDSINLNGGITLSGGYSKDTWLKNTQEETVLLPGEYFKRDSSLMISRGERNSLRNLRIYDTSGLSSSLLYIAEGECSIGESSFERTGSGNGTLVELEKGTLYFNNCTMKISRSSGGSALKINGGTVYLSDSFLEGRASTKDFTLVQVSENARFLGGRSSFQSGSGETVTVFHGQGASIILTECDITTGNAGFSALAFRMKDAVLECAGCTISGDSGSRMSTTVMAVNSDITMYNSIISIQAARGAVGFSGTNSVVNLAACAIEAGEPEEFLYLFRLSDSNAYIFTNHLSAGRSADFMVAKLMGGNMKWFCNSGIFKGGVERSSAFEINNTAFISIINSIMVQTETSREGAFFITPKVDSIESLSNNIHGWGAVLEAPGRIIADVDSLNGSDGNPLGGRLHGNLSEPPGNTFIMSKENPFRLQSGSQCINRGFDVRPLGGPERDWDNQIRPNPYHGIKPAYDIGADEYYE